MQLYEKHQTGSRVRYVPHVPIEETPTIIEMSDKQMLTVAGALGITLLTLYERVLPPHKRVARKVEKVKDSVVDLFQSAGDPVDVETMEWLANAWDSTMRSMTAQ